MCCGTCSVVRTKSPDTFSTYDVLNGSVLNIATLPTAPVTPPTGVNAGHTLIQKYDNGTVYWTYDGTNWVRNFYSIDIYHTHDALAGSNILENALPAVPVNPPTSVEVGHTLHERYDNGSVYWTFNGTTWDRDFVITDCCHAQNDETGNVINTVTLPTAPLNPIANPTTGDTINERYDNGNVYWTWNGTTWVRDFVVVAEDIYNTHSNQATNIAENALPAAPVAPPAGVLTGHTLHENYLNGQIFWTFDGTNWIRDYVITDCCHAQEDTATILNATIPPTQPVTIPTGSTTGDTITENHPNGQAYWTYNGTAWVLDFLVIPNTDDIHHNHSNQVASAIDENALPATPVVPPANAITGDTLHEYFSNASVYWTFDGTNWVRNFVITDCCHVQNDQSGSNINEAALPTVPVTPTVNPTSGDTIIEKYDNGQVYWTWDGTTWVRDFVVTDCCHLQNDETGNVIDLLNPPTAPLNPTTTPTTGDTIIENYDNGQVYWTWNGTTWVRDFIVSPSTADIYNTNSNQAANALDANALPTVPVNPPANVITSHTLHENYSNGEAFWTFDGTNWNLDYVIIPGDGCCTYFDDAPGNVINEAALPVAPVAPPLAPNASDTLIENYDNGQVYWTFDGTNWVLDYVVTGGCCITLDTPGIYDCANPPTAPVNPPANPSTDNIHIEFYSNNTRNTAVTVHWQWDGAAWVMISTEFHARSFHAQSATDIVPATLPTTPITPGTGQDYIDGDTLIEDFANGQVYWSYDCATAAWVRDMVNIDCECESFITPIINADVQDICAGGAVNFTDNSVFHNGNDTTCVYTSTTWDFGDGTATATGQTVAHTFAEPGNYFITSTTLCQNANISVVVTTPVVVSEVAAIFSTSAASINEGGSVSITNNSTVFGCPATYLWDFGDGSATSNLVNPPAHTYATAGTYTITLTVTCANGCSSNTTQMVVVNVASGVVANFLSSLSTICTQNSQSTQLTDTSTSTGCTIDTWLWEISVNGGAFTTYSTLQNPPNYQPANGTGGSHAIRLTATCSATTDSNITMQTITVIDIVAGFTASSLAVAPNDVVTLTDTTTVVGCTGATYSWTVSIDGGAATEFSTTAGNTTYTPTVAGTHAITLTVTCGGCSSTSTQNIVVAVAGAVTASFTIDDPILCVNANETATFADTSTAVGCTIDTWLWELSINGGAFANYSTLQTPPAYMAQVADAGPAVMRLTATCSATGDSNTTTTNFAITNVVAGFTPATLTSPSATDILLTDTTTVANCVGATYSWTVAIDGGAATEFSTTVGNVTYNSPTVGSHVITLTVTCPNGCVDTATATIVLSDTCTATPSFTVTPTTVAIGDVITLTDTSTLVGCTPTYEWAAIIDNTQFVSVNNVVGSTTFTPTIAGEYIFQLTITCAEGCSNVFITSTIVTVEQDPFLTSNFTTDKEIYCVDSDIILTNITTSNECTPDSWLWEYSVNGGPYQTHSTLENPPVLHIDPPGVTTYDIRLTTMCSDGGLTSTYDHSTVTGSQIDMGPIQITFGETNWFVGDSFQLLGTLTGAGPSGNGCALVVTYTISIDGGPEQEILLDSSGMYTVTQEGAYVITKTAQWNNPELCGDCIEVETLNINVAPGADLVAAFEIEGNDNCVGNTLQFNDTSISTSGCTIDTWEWLVNGVLYSTAQVPPPFVIPNATAQNVELNITCNPGATTATTSHSFTANQVTAGITNASGTTTMQVGETKSLTGTDTNSGCFITNSRRIWSVQINGGTPVQLATGSPLNYTPTVAGTHVLTYSVSGLCDDCTDSESITLTVTDDNIVLPCVNAVCYTTNTADNPDTTRMWTNDSQGYNGGTIASGAGQNFNVTGNPTAKLNVKSSGNGNGNTQLVGSAPSVLWSANQGQTGTLTFTFNEPICGTLSVGLLDIAGGQNPAATGTFVGNAGSTVGLATRHDSPSTPIFTGASPSVTSTNPVGGGATRFFVNVDNLTTLTVNFTGATIYAGFYISEIQGGCGYEILHCPTNNTFFVKNAAGQWVAAPQFNHVGEWEQGTC